MNLNINNLTLAYGNGSQTIRPINGFNLSVRRGDLVLLHGPSGCGKTTLLSAIAGLLTPESGSIRVEGNDVTKMTTRARLVHRRDHIGMVFQRFNLLPSLTALENVVVPLRVAGVRPRVARIRATALLDQFGLGERLHHRPDQLSGGQQQRVAIARALANDPPVLLADEPTAHLDHTQVATVRSTLRSLADEGRVVLVSTHDVRLDGVADRIVSMVPQQSGFAPLEIDSVRSLVTVD